MMPKTVVTDFGNRGGQCQGGRLLYLVKLLYVILHFQNEAFAKAAAGGNMKP